MQLYEITITADSLFGTPLVGDTLFGQLCWQFIMDTSLLQKEFAQVIAAYKEQPFCILSSAFPKVVLHGSAGYAIPRPALSLFTGSGTADRRQRRIFLDRRKEMKRKKWLFVDQSLRPDFTTDLLLNEADLAASAWPDGDGTTRYYKSFHKAGEEMHNSINRLTGTTGEGFAPYSTPVTSILPGAILAVFALLDEEVCQPQALRTAFERIGAFGYGRDASSGKGRFAVCGIEKKVAPSTEGANACYALAPSVPEMGDVACAWCTPLTRFGKHGGGAQLGAHPFKSPVVMADTGAVLVMRPERLWLGQGITGVSKQIPATVVQGYAPCLPCSVEV